jgi:hypothetical protein
MRSGVALPKRQSRIPKTETRSPIAGDFIGVSSANGYNDANPEFWY